MVEDGSQELDRVFHALADPTRRAILHRLSRGEHRVSELAEPFDMSLAAVSKHLGALERAGLVRRERRGRERLCSLEPHRLRDAWRWLAYYERFWNERLDALEAVLRGDGE